MNRNIKPENWQVLAGTIEEVICQPGAPDMHYRIVNTFRAGRPPQDYIQLLVALCNRCIRRTYSSWERARAKSLLETLQNYGLVTEAQIKSTLA